MSSLFDLLEARKICAAKYEAVSEANRSAIAAAPQKERDAIDVAKRENAESMVRTKVLHDAYVIAHKVWVDTGDAVIKACSHKVTRPVWRYGVQGNPITEVCYDCGVTVR